MLFLLHDQLGNVRHHWPLVNAQLKKESRQTNGQIYTACLVNKLRVLCIPLKFNLRDFEV